MATLVFTAIGNAIGGPLGGAIGALVGQQIDTALFGPGGRQGPRITDLKVTTSTYGSAIARHHGTIRAPGTIIWATDLVDHDEKQGGGKGSPSVTTYTYSVSFAVALASRPIAGIGRIWADGNLLRGQAGDLKVGGTLRIYSGHGDNDADPLIAAAEGAHAPAFRGTAYALFEDLDLSSFGNRIPALSFEVVADDGEVTIQSVLEELGTGALAERPLADLAGFSYEGGPIVSALATLDSVYPLAVDAGGGALTISAADTLPDTARTLPEAAAAHEEASFGAAAGRHDKRQAGDADAPNALRYYDTGRDYLAGLQRADGRARPGRESTIDFPGALSADAARRLASAAAERADAARETLAWRTAELDPALAPGTVVKIPNGRGLWRITGWEWRESGVELELRRLPRSTPRQTPGASGSAQLPADVVGGPTILDAFELPWDGVGTGETRQIFAAPSSTSAGWAGSALYAELGGQLAALGSSKRRAVSGSLSEPLTPSRSLVLERTANVTVTLHAADFILTDASPEGLAAGANRALVGSEILQFATAVPLGEGQWRLEGLLRGRGGTEACAQAGHSAGARFVLLDERLIALDPSLVGEGPVEIVAIGLADAVPATALLADAGRTLRPLSPVHASAIASVDGDLMLSWRRRARGAWRWRDEIETPLIEEWEKYQVGLGPLAAPLVEWTVFSPSLSLSASVHGDMSAANPGQPIWVRQVGTHALSDPLLLHILP